MSDSYVCSGAKMRCSMGNKEAQLTVLPTRTVYLCGQPMANVSDHVSMVNLAPFGLCRSMGFPATAAATAAHLGVLTPMPCVHNTPAPWIPGKTDYFVKGQPALLRTCTCQCMWGGTISLITDGQLGEGTQYVQKKSKSSAEEIQEETNAQNGLSSESILDGLQLALDVAGFVPGVGAFADLANSAIYAMRGDMINASLSLIAAVPGLGDAAAAAKMVNKGVKAAKTMGKTAKATEGVAKMGKEATSVASLSEKTSTKATQMTEKKALREARLKKLGPDAKWGGSETLYDTAPTTQGQKKLLEVTKKKPDTSGKGSFNDLTPGDRFEVENKQVWNHIEKESQSSSWNPFTVKETPGTNGITNQTTNINSQTNVGEIKPDLSKPEFGNESQVRKVKDFLNTEKAKDAYSTKEPPIHTFDCEI